MISADSDAIHAGVVDAGVVDAGVVDAVVMVRALADPMRSRIVDLLAREQLCTCHLVELTGARQTNVSNHLRILREAGLIVAEPAGRYTFYRLVPEAFQALAAHLGQLAERARVVADGTVRRACP